MVKQVFLILILLVFTITVVPSIYGVSEQEYDVIITDKKLYDQNDLVIFITGTLHPSMNGNASEDYGRIIGFTVQGPNDRDIDVLGLWSTVDRNGNFVKELKIAELGSDIKDEYKHLPNGIYTIGVDIGNYRHLETSFQFGQSYLNISTDKKLYNLHDLIMITGNGDFEFASYDVEIINPIGDLSAIRTITSNIYGDFRTSFQIDNLVNLVNGTYTIEIPNITYNYTKINFEVDNIEEKQKSSKPKTVIEQQYDDFNKLIQELDMSNSKLKFYLDLEAENVNLKNENELLQVQLINLQNIINGQFKVMMEMLEDFKINQ